MSLSEALAKRMNISTKMGGEDFAPPSTKKSGMGIMPALLPLGLTALNKVESSKNIIIPPNAADLCWVIPAHIVSLIVHPLIVTRYKSLLRHPKGAAYEIFAGLMSAYIFYYRGDTQTAELSTTLISGGVVWLLTSLLLRQNDDSNRRPPIMRK